MKTILCYGDSNTWGCEPVTFRRYDWNTRWPGIAQRELGPDFHVVENALNGRTTVFEDPIEEGRCGKIGFTTVLETCAPLDLVILMLGCNDCKDRFMKSAWDIAWGMELLVQYVRRAACGVNGASPEILIVPPVELGTKWDQHIHGTVFNMRSTEISRQLPETYKYIAERCGCHFFDPNPYATAGADCVHISPEDHKKLGLAIAAEVRKILA